jgi:hypothetical protein
MKTVLKIITVILILSTLPSVSNAKHETIYTSSSRAKIPGHVLNISKDNTYPNPVQDLQSLEPSSLTRKLIKTSKIKIENPDLIKLLNESSIKNAPLAVGYRANIYLGYWPLNYSSQETTVNWEYHRININYIDNRGGNTTKQLHYSQDSQKTVRGGLTSKIESSDQVKKMIQLEAVENSKLPLSFETVIGVGTKKDQVYNIPSKKLGYLYTYVPAVNERGKVTFGEVYLVLEGNKKQIKIRNVTSQGIGAWIPVQEYLSFSFMHSNTPR